MTKCVECGSRTRKRLITNDKLYHDCNAVGKTICYGDKLPKTSPRWCPLRLQDKPRASYGHPGPNEWD